MSGSRHAKTRYSPQNSKNSKMEELCPPIFEYLGMIRRIRRWAARHATKRDAFQRIRKNRRWKNHARQSSNILAKFEEFEDEWVATRENAIHSKEFEKSEDWRTMAANLRICACLKKFEDWRAWFLHLRIFRILWNVSRFVASRPIHLRILRIVLSCFREQVV